jgi:hypothetical protein
MPTAARPRGAEMLDLQLEIRATYQQDACLRV